MRLFLDTNVLTSATSGNKQAAKLFLKPKEELFTNEYVLKELRRVLLEKYGATQKLANTTIDEIRRKCTVLPSPSKQACKKIKIEDRSDTPIVAGALQASAALVTLDRKLLKQAKKTRQNENTLNRTIK
ncbi:MAG: PIN domain-containing protein [Candidatus Micrarchaeia archaeon]